MYIWYVSVSVCIGIGIDILYRYRFWQKSSIGTSLWIMIHTYLNKYIERWKPSAKAQRIALRYHIYSSGKASGFTSRLSLGVLQARADRPSIFLKPEEHLAAITKKPGFFFHQPYVYPASQVVRLLSREILEALRLRPSFFSRSFRCIFLPRVFIPGCWRQTDLPGHCPIFYSLILIALGVYIQSKVPIAWKTSLILLPHSFDNL